MPYPSHRRLFGLLLGALTGLAYALVSQNINRLMMPGVPFYQPPFGPVGNTLLSVLLGMLLGVITAWPEVSVKGVLLGSLSGAVAIAAATLMVGAADASTLLNRLAGIMLIFFPTTTLLAAGLLVFRRLTDREEAAYRENIHWRPPARLPRIGLPAALVLAAGLVGLTAMYNDLARAVTPRMLALLETARLAETADQLPEPLRAQRVTAAFENIQQDYTLQWDKDDRNQFAIGRPNTSPFDQSTVIARFENGYLLACMYPDPTYEPRCIDIPAGQTR